MRLKTLLVASSAVVLSGVQASQATLIASDSFLSGTDTTTTYTDSTAIQGQAPAATGFSAAGWTSGIGTANFTTTSGGLNDPVLSPTPGGKVNWLGATSSASRSIARNLTTSQGSSTFVYYTSQIVERGSDSSTAPSTGSFVGIGYANSTFPATGATSGNLFGFYVGFVENSGTDQGSLTLRARVSGTSTTHTVIVDGSTTSTANVQYTVITKAETNYTGGSTDRITYWVNPTNTSSEAAMTASAAYTNAASPLITFALQGAGDLPRLNFAAAGAFAPTAFFDETRLGTALADVVAAPEQTSLGLLAATGLLLARRRRA